jgi:serine/threonine protein kinase
MLLTDRNHIKLADLGIAKLMEETHASTYAGTKEYMSPEVFKTRDEISKYYPNTDIWYSKKFIEKNQSYNLKLMLFY